jgi:Leucine-rich repeat (LRR) protein
LVHLLGLTGLHVLSLDNTQVSDAGLTHLQGMAQLQWLDLSNTPISEAGVAQLQKALPNCRISR